MMTLEQRQRIVEILSNAQYPMRKKNGILWRDPGHKQFEAELLSQSDTLIEKLYESHLNRPKKVKLKKCKICGRRHG